MNKSCNDSNFIAVYKSCLLYRITVHCVQFFHCKQLYLYCIHFQIIIRFEKKKLMFPLIKGRGNEKYLFYPKKVQESKKLSWQAHW
jgi:hypothetical protein